MASFSFKNGAKSTTAQTLIEGNSGTDDSGTIDSTSSLIVASGTAVNLTLTNAPATGGAGIVITNAGTLTSSSGRTIDSGSSAIATGAKLTINNSGTISNAGGSSNGDVIRINNDMVSGTFLLYNTGTISSAAAVNDGVGVRLGKIYTASTITIDNGIDASGTKNTSATISTADADAVRPGGVNPTNSATAFGSSTVLNYGTISASYQTGSGTAQLSKINGVDIGGGQSSTVLNYGSISGDENGLGSDNTSGGAGFAANYNVTNYLGGTITGNNGAGIAVGSVTTGTSPVTVLGTAMITNLGTITGNAVGVGRTKTSGTAPVVSIANGTGIYTTSTATIVNGSAAVTNSDGTVTAGNTTALIQGTGVIGTTSTQGGGTYYAIDIGSGTITNYGTIAETIGTGGKAATNAGAAIKFSGTVGSTVTNYGAITGVNGLAIAFGNGTNTLNLYTGSSETGTILGGTGTDTLNLGLGMSTSTGTLSGVSAFEVLNVTGGSWTITDAETYTSGVTIASGASLTLGPNGSTGAAVTDNGTLVYTETGTFTKSQAITGTGKLVHAGTGTLVLSNAGNTYSGGTTFTSGALDVTTAGAAGTGAITFGSGTQTLDIEQAALASDGSFAETLASVGPEDTIDLRGIGTATGATFNSSTNVLTVTGGSQTVTLKLDSAGAPAAGYAYGVSADNNTASPGTNIAIDQIATVTGVATSPSSGYVKAGQTVTITITTSKAVSIAGSAPVLNLSGGGTAAYNASASTSTSLVFTDTVAAGQDASGITITSITNAGSVEDAFDVPVNFSNAINKTPIGPTIDTTPPTVAIATQAGLTNSATQTISGTVDTADDGTTVTVYETYNGATNAIGTATVSSGANGTTAGTWTASVNLTSGNGTHAVYAADTDAAGNTGTSSSVTYDLETTAPTVTITSQAGLTNKPSQTISGTVDTSADPEAEGSTVTVTDTSNGNVLGTGTVTNGAFSVGVTLSGDGTHAVQIADLDKANNQGFASATYTLDTVAPAAPALVLADDTGASSTDKITSDPTITYTASASGDTLLYKADSATSYSTTVPTFAANGTADGTHTVYVEEEDPAGNISTPVSLTFTLDTTAPTTAPTLALANDTGTSQSDKITSDPTVTYTPGTSGDTLLYKADNATSYSTIVPTITTDGIHTVYAEDVDAAGNIGPAGSLTFTLDKTAPAAPSLQLADDTGMSGTDKITSDPTITYTASSRGDTLLYKADGATTYSATVPTFAVDGSADGSHTLSVEEEDAAGNISNAASLTFVLDTTPPDVDFTSRGGAVNKATQIVNGTVGAADAGTTVSIFEDGGTTAVATAVANANGYWSASVALGADGTHTLTARDTDTAGNTGTTDQSLSYNVNSTAPTFTAGNLVISISGDGDGSGNYTDNQATPLTLEQITTDGTYVSELVLPQTSTTVNGVTQNIVSAEYGSSSEGSLQLSADGHSLVIAGYGVNAQTYNAGGAAVYGNAALAQSTSIQGGTYTAVQRVIADINANGTIDTSTALYNVFNTNNPRSVATIDGTSFYISGQGVKGDTTQGLFLVQDGATTATSIDHSTDTRTAVIYNGQLYVSRDSKQGSGGTSNISVYGATLPTKTTTGTILEAIDKSVTITAATGNTVNGSADGSAVALDPENFFFANATTLYVADGGVPKQGGAGDGGLQKWTYNGTSWTLQYTLSAGLDLVGTGASVGTTGLIGLTGKVVGDTVELYATNETVGDLDQKYVYGITDSLSATTNAGQSFTTLVTAAADTNIRGIAFAPTAITPTLALANDTGVSATDHITSDPTIVYTKAESADTLLYKVGSGTYSTTAPTFTTDGTYTVYAEEEDKGGNIGPASSLTFTLDRTADAGGDLTVSFGTNAATPGEVNAANAPAASFTVSGLDSDASATVTFSGTAIGGGARTVTATETANGTYTANLSGFQDGTITAAIAASDVAGNTATGGGATTVLDTTAEAGGDLAINFGSNGATAGDIDAAHESAASFTVSGLDSDATATVTFSGTSTSGAAMSVTATASANGAETVDLSGFQDGTITASISATDQAGNTATGAGANALLDTTAPVAPTLALANDSGTSSTDKITNDPTITYTLSAAGDTLLYNADGATSSNGSLVYTTNVPTFATNGSQDGQHTVSVEEEDPAGNIGQATSLTFTLDTMAPTTAPTLALADDTGTSSTDKITSDPTLTYAVGTTGDTLLYKADGATNYSTTAPVFATNGTQEGSHTVTVAEEDTAGNIGPAASLTFTLDTVAPAAPTIALAHDTGTSSTDKITNDPTITYTPAATGDTLLYNADGATNTSGSLAYTTTAPVFATDGSQDGQHSIMVAEEDTAGNIGPAASLTFTLDTRAPGAPSLALADDTGESSTDGITGDPTITYTPAASGDTLLYASDGSAFSTIVPSFATDGSDDGSHTISAEEEDAAGNIGPASSLTFTLDTSAPTVSLTGTTTDALQGGAAVVVLASKPSVSDPNGNGMLYGATVTIANPKAGDLLGVAGSQTGTFDSGKISYSWSTNSETLTLSGADTIAAYKNVLAQVTYQDSGSDTTSASHPTRTLDWTVTDAVLASTVAATTVTIDRPPVATADMASVLSGATVSATTAAAGLVGNDTDADGDTLSVTSIASGSTAVTPITTGGSATIAGTYGSLTANSDGRYSYAATNGIAIVTAADGMQINDVFSYAASDGNGGTITSTLTARVSLATGGVETVTNPTGSATYSIGATTLTLNDTAASTYVGSIQDGSSGNTGGTVSITGSGTLTLTGTNTYTGTTQLSGSLALSGSGSIAASRKLQLLTSTAVFDVSSATSPVSINKLVGVAGSVIDLGATSLSVNEVGGPIYNASGLFAGTIQNGSNGSGGAFALSGPGTLTLTGTNTYTGTTQLSGSLALSGSGSIAASRKLQLLTNTAVFDVSGAASPVSINKLVGVAGSVIDLGATSLSVNEIGGSTYGAAGLFAGTIQDGPNGVGGKLVVNGTGPLTLSNTNTYTGGTSLAGGTLELAAAGAAGSGTITFTGAATLEIDAAALTSSGNGEYDFSNLIAGATSTSQVIDLTSLTYVQGSTTATLSSNTVSVGNGTSDVTLHLASTQPNSTFKTASDGHGGTLVFDPPAASTFGDVTSGAPATIDSSWLHAAMAPFGGVPGDASAGSTLHDPYGIVPLTASSEQAHAASVFGQSATRPS